MIGFLHTHKTNDSMAASADILQKRLGEGLFSKIFPVILTDRGSAFEKHHMFEVDGDGALRLNIFYCDLMQSSHKPHVENNHNYVRDIIPNNYPTDNLAQTDINLTFSHINSTPRRSLANKTPFEMFSFFYGEDAAATPSVKQISPGRRNAETALDLQ